MHPASALLGPPLALQRVPLPLAAVDAGGLRGAQVHRVVVWGAPVLAAAVGTKAATEGHDRLCHLGETSQPRCSPAAASPGSSSSGGDALLRAGMRESCSTWQGGEALLKTLGRAGLLFPHLGTGTGTSPSVSPSISLRASTLAEERGEKQECVSQSGQHGSGPARGSAHLGFG